LRVPPLLEQQNHDISHREIAENMRRTEEADRVENIFLQLASSLSFSSNVMHPGPVRLHIALQPLRSFAAGMIALHLPVTSRKVIHTRVARHLQLDRQPGTVIRTTRSGILFGHGCGGAARTPGSKLPD